MKFNTDFWYWWLNEITRAIPFFQRVSTVGTFYIGVRRSHCLIEKRLDGTPEVIETTTTVHAAALAKLLTEVNSCVIVLAESRYISRHLSDRKLPFTRARQIAELDLAEETPFSINDVFICFLECTNSTLGTDYILIRKDVLEPILQVLLEARICPQYVMIESGRSELRLSRQSLRSIHPIFRRKSWPQRLSGVASSAIVIAGMLTFGHVYYRYSLANEQLQSAVDVKQKAALEVRKLLEQRGRDESAVLAVWKSKTQTEPVVRVWEELSRILPDTAWITEFSVIGDDLAFSGFAGSSAGLITALDESPLFSDPSFTSPVTRVPEESGERFAIKLKVVRK